MAFAHIGISLSAISNLAVAESAKEITQEEVEKGPNNGRVLRQGDLAIELAIYETDTPPEFRVYASYAGQRISAEDIEVNVKLTRLGDGIDDIDFYVEGNYLRGDMVIYEPHSFLVSLTANYQGKTYEWSYDNYEGRTKIDDSLAKAMDIKTDFVSSKKLNARLKVYGQLVLPPNAVRNISARYPGEITSVDVILGQAVKKGQTLFTIQSSESLQSYQVKSPIDGLITFQDIGVGEQSGDKKLVAITDTSQLIAELNVYPEDQNKKLLDAPVDIQVPGHDKTISTKIFDSLYAVNGSQAKVYRAIVNNNDGFYSPGQFISAQILFDSFTVERAVKEESLQAFRDFTVVYGKFGDQYEVRMLELGRKAEGWVEVLNGIPSGTEYVTLNSYIIKADIEKSGASHDH
ncbi:secretion protein HlyD [Alteromonas macleodii]|nr:secretion protein HlyD [Alteromonas macleodii]